MFAQNEELETDANQNRIVNEVGKICVLCSDALVREGLFLATKLK